MDKFVVRSPKPKRKSPEQLITSSPAKKTRNKGNEEKPEKLKEEKKAKLTKEVKKSEKKLEKKPEKKPEKTVKKAAEKVAKRPETPEEMEDKKMKNLLRTTGGTKKEAKLGEILPTIKCSKNKVISDEELERLFHALCPNNGKMYDSDDSIISEIDHMDAAEISAKDQKFRDNIKFIEEMPQRDEMLKMMLKMGNETKEERAKRLKMLREMRNELKPKKERDSDEKKRLKDNKKLENLLNTVVRVFDVDAKRLCKLVEEDEKNDRVQLTTPPRLMKCGQFARFLEVMAELAPNEKKTDEAIDYRQEIKEIDSVELQKRIDSCGIRGEFFKEGKTTADYLKKKVRKIFREPEILDVFGDKVFGFDFTTKDCLLAFENYYSLNIPPGDNGKMSKALGIKIKKFISSCHHVARSQNPKFVLNDNLKMALFD